MKLPTVFLRVARFATMMTRHWLLMLTCSVAKYHWRRSLVLAITVLTHSTIIVAVAVLVGMKTG